MSAPDSFPSKDNQDKPLSKEAAHEEADMLRAKMEISPRTGKGPEGFEPTAADYDAALTALEELKELAAREPVTERVLGVLGRLSADASMIVAFVMAQSPSKSKNEAERYESMATKIDEYRKINFEDAAYKLRQLKSKAKQYNG